MEQGGGGGDTGGGGGLEARDLIAAAGQASQQETTLQKLRQHFQRVVPPPSTHPQLSRTPRCRPTRSRSPIDIAACDGSARRFLHGGIGALLVNTTIQLSAGL